MPYFQKTEKFFKVLSFIQDQDGVITAEELQGCLTAIGHIVESNDPARVNLTPRPSLRSLFPLLLSALKSLKSFAL